MRSLVWCESFSIRPLAATNVNRRTKQRGLAFQAQILTVKTTGLDDDFPVPVDNETVSLDVRLLQNKGKKGK